MIFFTNFFYKLLKLFIVITLLSSVFFFISIITIIIVLILNYIFRDNMEVYFFGFQVNFLFPYKYDNLVNYNKFYKFN